MKIKTEDAIYVQKNDIAYLQCSNIPIPSDIFEKLFMSNIDYVYINDSNRYDFFKFEKESEIEFFDGIDFIVDYNEVKHMHNKDILTMIKKILIERNKLVKKFNLLSKEEKNNNSKLGDECDYLEYKANSLGDIIRYRKGLINFDFPEELEITKKNKPKSLIKRLKNKDKK